MISMLLGGLALGLRHGYLSEFSNVGVLYVGKEQAVADKLFCDSYERSNRDSQKLQF